MQSVTFAPVPDESPEEARAAMKVFNLFGELRSLKSRLLECEGVRVEKMKNVEAAIEKSLKKVLVGASNTEENRQVLEREMEAFRKKQFEAASGSCNAAKEKLTAVENELQLSAEKLVGLLHSQHLAARKSSGQMSVDLLQEVQEQLKCLELTSKSPSFGETGGTKEPQEVCCQHLPRALRIPPPISIK